MGCTPSWQNSPPANWSGPGSWINISGGGSGGCRPWVSPTTVLVCRDSGVTLCSASCGSHENGHVTSPQLQTSQCTERLLLIVEGVRDLAWLPRELSLILPKSSKSVYAGGSKSCSIPKESKPRNGSEMASAMFWNGCNNCRLRSQYSISFRFVDSPLKKEEYKQAKTAKILINT